MCIRDRCRMFSSFAKASLICGISLFAISCSDQKIQEPLSAANIAAMDDVFSNIEAEAPGCVLGVMKDGKMLYQNGYGLANLEHNIPITPDTVFRIASTSKQFTAMSTIILAQEGRISLDDDIRKYVPEMPDYGERITTVSYTHLRAHETVLDLVCRLLLEKKKIKHFYRGILTVKQKNKNNKQDTVHRGRK
eukprot:TRINITY_DN1854_c0_g1_i1.p1 TRINITY_DN1854_c0_g1~~TRINITY_DN1854_c0_g1_i1.p1  ORF type:complete len:192 (-),score=11.75 TRINITY_DN1854_c0_g1_i1:11-586(-)